MKEASWPIFIDAPLSRPSVSTSSRAVAACVSAISLSASRPSMVLGPSRARRMDVLADVAARRAARPIRPIGTALSDRLVLPTADRLLDGPLVVPSPGCASRLPFALRAADVGSSRELLFLAGALSCGAAFPVLDPVLGSVLG